VLSARPAEAIAAAVAAVTEIVVWSAARAVLGCAWTVVGTAGRETLGWAAPTGEPIATEVDREEV